MPDTGHGTELVLSNLSLRVDTGLRMGALENLDGDNKCILEQIVVDHTVEDVDSTVVTSTGEERELGVGVIGNLADSLVMVLK